MDELIRLRATVDFDDDGFREGVSNTGNSMEGLSSKTIAMGQLMADAIEMVIGKVIEYGQKIVEVGMQTETALAKVNTIMDTSKMTTGEMADNITELSNKMGISVTELSDTVYNAISATGDTLNAVDLAEKASMLATAGFTDTSSALSVLTTTMNAYGMSAEEASGISDSLITVQNLGVTTVAELSASMGKAIASASAYGVNLENLESAYISITKAGINTAEGTTYISSMLKELGDSGSTVAGVIEEKTGKSFGELLNEGKSLGDVLGILSDSVNGDSTAMMNLWSSAEAGKGASAIFGQGIDAFNENLATLQMSLTDTADETGTAFDIMADTLQHKVDVFHTNGENLMTALYNGMSGNLGEIVNFGTEAIQELAEAFESGGIDTLAFRLGDVLAEALQMSISYIGNIADVAMRVIEGLLAGLSENSSLIGQGAVNVVQTLLDGLNEHIYDVVEWGLIFIKELIVSISEGIPQLATTAVDIISGLVEALLMNAPMMLEGAISVVENLAQGIFEALPMLISQIPNVVTWIVDALTTGLPMLIDGAISLIIGIVDALPDIIIALVEALPYVVSSIITGLMECLPQLILGAMELCISLAEHYPEIIMAILTAIPDIILAIVDAFADMPAQAIEIGKKFIDAMGEAIKALPERFMNVYNMVKTKAEEFKANLATKAKDIGQRFIEGIINLVKTLPQKFWQWLLNTINKVLEFRQKMIDTAIQTAKDFATGLIDGVKAIPDKMLEIGGNIVQGLKDGIANAWDSLTSWFSDKATGLIDGVKGVFGIASPSKKFRYIGEMCVAGFEDGSEGIFSDDGLEAKVSADIKTNATVSTQGSELARIESLLARYLPQMGKDIVLNTGALVGGIAGDMDIALGQAQLVTARGI